MKVTLRERLKGNSISLYLDYYHKGKRKNEFLRLYLNPDPKTKAEKDVNKKTRELAETIRAQRQIEMQNGTFGFHDIEKLKGSFTTYLLKLSEDRNTSDGNYGNWDSMIKHFKTFAPYDVSFQDLDRKLVENFRTYLDSKAESKSKKKLSQNSKYSYFNKFKAALRNAFDNGYLTVNYASKVKSFEQAESQREYLIFDELQRLAKAECKYPVLKKAFLFSCLSGLRWSDINTLIWKEVRDEGDVSKVNFRQEKTDGVEYLYISKQARELLGERQDPQERVFKGLKYGMTYNTEIVRWCNRAAVPKHITFHSARHTNAVLLLENGADIYTVSKRLGHRELRTTQIYAKIVDSKMKEAAEIIPELTLEI